MNTLPNELKDHIGSFLKHPTDLANWARTSSAFLVPARWFLYQKVDLADDLPHLKQTLDLLRREKLLRRSIISLKLVTQSFWNFDKSTQTWLDLTLFKGMDRLRTITFDGIPCVPAKNFQRTIAAVYRDCPTLQEISAVNITWPDASATPNWVLDDNLVAPSTLRKVAFESEFSSEMRKFFASTFFNPSNQLNVLELGLENNIEALKDITNHEFPSLNTFNITGFSSGVSTELITFLGAHPSIETLSVLDADASSLGPIRSTKNILPNLRSLTASPQFVENMVAMCDTVKLLHSLALDFSTSHSSALATAGMMQAVVGGFPNLKHCSVLHTYSPVNAGTILRLFVGSRELEWWTGGFYYHDSRALDEIGAVLASFPMLKRVDICEWSSPPETLLPVQLGGFEKMLKRNASLTKICLYMPHTDSQEIATVLNVHRKEGLREVYRYVEDGPYVQDRRYFRFDAVQWQDDFAL